MIININLEDCRLRIDYSLYACSRDTRGHSQKAFEQSMKEPFQNLAFGSTHFAEPQERLKIMCWKWILFNEKIFGY